LMRKRKSYVDHARPKKAGGRSKLSPGTRLVAYMCM
jgi:hypothetical protein